MRKPRLVVSILFTCLFSFLLPVQAVGQGDAKVIAPIVSMLLEQDDITMEEKIPSLALMVATGTDKIEMAWIPGSDGKTPVNAIKYDIYLSTTAGFTPSPSTLEKSITGTSQTTITNLTTDTLYYGKVIATYSSSTSNPSNTLEAKTYKHDVEVDSSATIVNAADSGLGKHATTDGFNYTYSSGTPPPDGSLLFSEDVNGGTTLRLVISSYTDGSTVTVVTGDASLTDTLDRGSIYSSLQLFDVQGQSNALPATSSNIATSQQETKNDGSLYSRIEWKNNLLTAEQTTYAYKDASLKVEPIGDKSIIKLYRAAAVEESFAATVEAKFEPKLVTTAEWGGTVFKTLDSAKVAAQGTLSLTAEAKYNFSVAGSVSKDFTLFEKKWPSLYQAGPVPIYQEITLTMDVQASASASVEIDAVATAALSETVEVGATYDGSTWTPYITHDEINSLSASLDIAGEANAEIRLIPKIEVSFYTVVNSSLTVEPFANSSLTVEKTTDNVDFLFAHPEQLINLTSFDASLGIESNVEVNFSALGYSWDALPSTCVLGTGSCIYGFDPIALFSIPKLELSIIRYTPSQTYLKLQVTDGIFNEFSQSSVNWEVFPDDATITPGSCSQLLQTTTCSATFTPGAGNEYRVFVSGYGVLGEIGRQFKEIDPIQGICASRGVPGPETVIWQGREWQRCDDNRGHNWEQAKTYCQDLILDGHTDWYLPTKDELKSLVVCTNGHPVPLNDNSTGCGDDGYDDIYARPTIDSSFYSVLNFAWVFVSSTSYDANSPWFVSFTNGNAYPLSNASNSFVRCVR